MNRSDDISKNVNFGSKGANLDQKWAGLDFSRTINLYFLKEDHMISFYKKNQQNSMNRLEDISQNVDFGPKGTNLDQKGPKMGKIRFFPELSLDYFINRPKM